MVTRKPRRAVPASLPREPLTKKARAAISLYALLRSVGRNGSYSHRSMVDYVLRAERMRRRDLYTYLEERDYRWRKNSWTQLKVRRAAPAAPVKALPVPRLVPKRPAAAPTPFSLNEMSEDEIIKLIQSGSIPVRAAGVR